MAAKTRKARGAPRWTRDDILREAAETFSILPRPSTAARRAFVALLGEFWPDISEGTRLWVEDTLRRSRHVGADVLEALDVLVSDPLDIDGTDDGGVDEGSVNDGSVGLGMTPGEAGEVPAGRPTVIARSAPVLHRRGMRVTATVSGRAREPLPVNEILAGSEALPGNEERIGNGRAREGTRISVTAPPLACEPVVPEAAPAAPPATDAAPDAATHVRAVMAHLAVAESDAAPALQPAEIEATLRDAPRPGPALARLLDLTGQRAESIVAIPRARGTAVALRALGVSPRTAEGLVRRWRGRAPAGFAETYAALPLDECLETVAGWRGSDAALSGVANRDGGLRRSA